jgi:hypothetical protein
MGGRGPEAFDAEKFFQKNFPDLAKKVTDFQTSEQSQGGTLLLLISNFLLGAP